MEKLSSPGTRAGVRALALCLLASVVVAPQAAASSAAPAVGPDTSSAIALERFGRLPMRFEENLGQSDAQVRFITRGNGYAVFLTPAEAVFALESKGDGPEQDRGVAYVRMRYVGASAATRVEGLAPQPGSINHIRSGQTVTGARSYASVRYDELYPGVDLLYYATDRGLEYDYVVAPGASPSAIALELEGATSLRVDASGDLVVGTAAGELRQHRPVLYQERDGRREPVSGAFSIGENGLVRFVTGEYDRSRPLVVDPVVTYSTYLGGNNPDRALDVKIDAAGSAYLTGRTFSPNFPTVGPFQGFNAGNYDVFVTKFTPDGSALVYSTYVGGTQFDTGESLAVDAAGDVYVTGYTGSTDFPTALAFQPEFAGGTEAFVFRLAAAGNDLVYSSFFGGSMTETAAGIAVDGASNAVFVGETNSTDIVTLGAIQTIYNGGDHDGFYVRLSPTGVPTNISYVGGFNDDAINAITFDAGGAAYLTGRAGVGFPTTPSAFQLNIGGGTSAFVIKIDAGFTAYVYSSYLGGSANDEGYGIAVDPAGNAYVGGETTSTNFPRVLPFQNNYATNGDGFITKVNAAGTAIAFSSYIGGTRQDSVNAVAVDAFGSVHMTGQTRSSNFPVVSPFQPTKGGNQLNDAFVARVAATGRFLMYSSYLGGSATDVGTGIAVDSAGTAFVSGYSDSNNFPTTANAFEPTQVGVEDAFLTRVFEPGDTPGVIFDAPSSSPAWFLRNTSSTGVGDIAFIYGPPGMFVYLAGDWNGDGVDTPGVYDPATSTFFLRNANNSGAANVTFIYGVPGTLIPVVGDWDGDGDDTIGLYDPVSATFFLKNTNAPGNADITFQYGLPGSGFTPIAGDWNGDGVDTIGLYDSTSGSWFLRNSNSPGIGDVSFFYGSGGPNVLPVVGDWNGDGIDTPGLFDSSTATWFLRNSNSQGVADVVFVYGNPGALPVAGDWNG